MTHVTDTLKEEHRWIRMMLDCLEKLVEGYRTRGVFHAKAASEMQKLFEDFVDGQHQDMEEAALIPKLMECVHRLLEDHIGEREHLERMRFNLFNAALGDPAGCEAFANEAVAYIELQRLHMARESLGLLPMAEQLLTPADDEEVMNEFAARRENLETGQVRERIRALCTELEVPFEEMAAFTH